MPHDILSFLLLTWWAWQLVKFLSFENPGMVFVWDCLQLGPSQVASWFRSHFRLSITLKDQEGLSLITAYHPFLGRVCWGLGNQQATTRNRRLRNVLSTLWRPSSPLSATWKQLGWQVLSFGTGYYPRAKLTNHLPLWLGTGQPINQRLRRWRSVHHSTSFIFIYHHEPLLTTII